MNEDTMKETAKIRPYFISDEHSLKIGCYLFGNNYNEREETQCNTA